VGCDELRPPAFCLLIPDPSTCHLNGAIAQLGERLLCKQEVVGSIPSGSTRPRARSMASNVEESKFRRLQRWIS
jgi:hypothetical protein